LNKKKLICKIFQKASAILTPVNTLIGKFTLNLNGCAAWAAYRCQQIDTYIALEILK
jgi:hypothetical protein